MKRNPAVPPLGGQGQYLKVGAVARHAGLTPQALHTYVLMGLIRPVAVTSGGQRLFDAQALERLELVAKLRASGYTLTQIREIFMKDR